MVKIQDASLEQLGRLSLFSFKHEFKGRVTELKTQGSIVNSENDQQIAGVFLWDTGATTSCINSNLISKLNLHPEGTTRVHTANGVIKTYMYVANILLTDTQNHRAESFDYKTLVISVDLKEDILGLIGMDIIGKGSFLVHYNSITDQHILQFSFPELEKFNHFNFKNEAKKQNKQSLKNKL